MSDRGITPGVRVAWHVFLYDRNSGTLTQPAGLMSSNESAIDGSPSTR
jgi:hypothetical protein